MCACVVSVVSAVFVMQLRPGYMRGACVGRRRFAYMVGIVVVDVATVAAARYHTYTTVVVGCRMPWCVCVLLGGVLIIDRFVASMPILNIIQCFCRCYS